MHNETDNVLFPVELTRQPKVIILLSKKHHSLKVVKDVIRSISRFEFLKRLKAKGMNGSNEHVPKIRPERKSGLKNSADSEF